jgi:hypothetical protein
MSLKQIPQDEEKLKWQNVLSSELKQSLKPNFVTLLCREK